MTPGETPARPETAAPTPAPTADLVTVPRARLQAVLQAGDGLATSAQNIANRIKHDQPTQSKLWWSVADIWCAARAALSSPVGETPEGK